jgi:anti-sigma factor RsiW
MTNFETHPTLDQLSDLLDGEIASVERQPIDEHLEYCSECAERISRLQMLLRDARALPDAVEPPPALWRDVRARVQPVARRSPQRWYLAAAAVLLVALSSGITALLVRRTPVAIVKREATPVASAALTLPAPARAVDADYAAPIRELNETLAQHRAQLDPATIAKVETSLAVIDSAIVEARHALAADPASLTLLDILSANYQRKLELLRRANELPPST